VSYVLKDSRMRPAEYARTVYFVVPETGTPFADVLTPEYWTHVAGKLKALDRIEVFPEEGNYFAELLVTFSSNNTVRVKELMHVDFDAEEMGDDEHEFEIKWSGPLARWRVIRKSDKAVLVEGDEVATRPLAEDWLRNYKRALAA
jgi:hypothetical protein